MIWLRLFSLFNELHGFGWHMYEGSLLGSLRSHDFIPHDHDHDVMMQREDRKRLAENISSFPVDIGYYDYLNPPHYSWIPCLINCQQHTKLVDLRVQFATLDIFVPHSWPVFFWDWEAHSLPLRDIPIGYGNFR